MSESLGGGGRYGWIIERIPVSRSGESLVFSSKDLYETCRHRTQIVTLEAGYNSSIWQCVLCGMFLDRVRAVR